MSAYMLAFVRIQNLDAYNTEYLAHAHAIITRHGGQALAVSDNITVLEGEMPKGKLVIVEFPSMAHAEAFYADPEYQPLIAIRQKYTQSDAAIFEKGFNPEDFA